MKHQFVICGAGIAGLTTAIALNRLGINPHIFEAAPEIKPVGAGLGLAPNAIQALKVLGIDKEVVRAGQFLNAMTIYDHHGKIISRADSLKISQTFGQDNFCIHRAELHKILLSHIDKEFIHTHKQILKIENNGFASTLFFTDGTVQKADYVIAADGINSVIRRHLLPQVEPRFAGYTCWRAVIDNSVEYPSAAEYWGPAGRFGLVPLPNHQLYWFCCVNSTRNAQEMKATTAQTLYSRFREYPEVIRQVLENSQSSQLIWGDILDLPPLSQFAFNNVVLIGDAAHATTPNMGQGACQAIEDAIVLAQEIEKTHDPAQAFKAFEKRRIKRTQEIVRDSERIGKVAQLENPLMIGIRNIIMKNLPQSFGERQLLKLYAVDF